MRPSAPPRRARTAGRRRHSRPGGAGCWPAAPARQPGGRGAAATAAGPVAVLCRNAGGLPDRHRRAAPLCAGRAATDAGAEHADQPERRHPRRPAGDRAGGRRGGDPGPARPALPGESRRGAPVAGRRRYRDPPAARPAGAAALQRRSARSAPSARRAAARGRHADRLRRRCPGRPAPLPARPSDWRAGVVSFHDLPLEQAIDEINRYRRGAWC